MLVLFFVLLFNLILTFPFIHRPIWWQIIDISDDSFIQQLSDEECADFSLVFASSLNVNSKDSWKVIAPAAERCLTSLNKVS